MKIFYKVSLGFICSILFNLVSNEVKATHIVGAELSYSCTTTPGVYRIIAKVYRDCSSLQLCANCPTSLSPSCGIPINVIGADAPAGSGLPGNPYAGVSYGTQNLTVVTATSAFDLVQLCTSAKSVCNNCGTRTPGTFTPGIEVYTFEGYVNLTALPSNCCLVSIGWGSCCRNAAVTTLTGAGSLNYYTEAILNRCTLACNSAPVFTNAPVFVTCAGQDFTYNPGAIDPDGDSLSYAFGSTLVSPGVAAPYASPYSVSVPFPYYGMPLQSPPALPPLGIGIDPISGDIWFRPVGSFASNLTIDVKQWQTIAGIPTLVGITKRDILFVSQICPNNTPPFFKTYDSSGVATPSHPNYNYAVCAGKSLCFIIAARDNTDPTDTTDISWNAPSYLTSQGATFTRLFNPASRSSNGPIYDSIRFCWTPSTSMASNLPYYFLVNAKDRACPVSGSVSHSFSIVVRKVPVFSINKTNKNCSKYDFSYTLQNNVPINNTATKFFIETSPHTDSFMVYNSGMVTDHQFLKGGWHRVKLYLTTITPPFPDGCPGNTIIDSVFVPDLVKVSISDTSNCHTTPFVIKASGHYGTPYGLGYRYTFYNGSSSSGSILKPFGADSNCTINPVTGGGATNYLVVIQDLNGCKDSALFHVFTRNIPTKEFPPSVRFCYGSNDTLNAGSSAETVKFWRWFKSPYFPLLTDSVSQKIIPQDSGRYVVKKMDEFGCSRFDTTFVYINPRIQTSVSENKTICSGSAPISIYANPVTSAIDSFYWRTVPVTDSSLILSKTNSLTVSPVVKTTYQVKCFRTYADLTCSSIDSVDILMNPVMNYEHTQTERLSCYGDSSGFAKVNISGGVKPYQYTWKNASGTVISNADSISQLKSGLYTIRILDSNNCVRNESVFINQPLQTINPQICAVTVDSATGKNLLVWNKINVARAVQYKLYRESSTVGQYTLIGTVNQNQPGSFLDTLSNPSLKYESYKLSVIDSCIHETELSSISRSFFLNANVGGSGEINLNWNSYVGSPLSRKWISRSVNGSPYLEIGQIPSNGTTTYTDQLPPNGIKKYRLEAELSDFCQNIVPTPVLTKIVSNEVMVNSTGFGNLIANTSLSIYPNPSNDKVFIEGATINRIELYDLMGQKVREVKDKTFIVVGDLASGVYLLKLYDGNRIILSNYRLQKN